MSPLERLTSNVFFEILWISFSFKFRQYLFCLERSVRPVAVAPCYAVREWSFKVVWCNMDIMKWKWIKRYQVQWKSWSCDIVRNRRRKEQTFYACIERYLIRPDVVIVNPWQWQDLHPADEGLGLLFGIGTAAPCPENAKTKKNKFLGGSQIIFDWNPVCTPRTFDRVLSRHQLRY